MKQIIKKKKTTEEHAIYEIMGNVNMETPQRIQVSNMLPTYFHYLFMIHKLIEFE